MFPRENNTSAFQGFYYDAYVRHFGTKVNICVCLQNVYCLIHEKVNTNGSINFVFCNTLL